VNDKQRRFAQEYIVDLNATQAAIRAGYSAKTAKQQGQRLLTNVDVQKAVQEQMNDRSEKTGLTAVYVLDGIKAATERCIGEGEAFNPMAAFKGYELLGKHLKLFTDKVDHSSPDGSMTPKAPVYNITST